jgi:3-methyl-2-oxobutanoate hydroxymethyltransferase
LGGFKLQGKTAQAAQRILDDALLLQKAGCFCLVLESVPANLAAYITDRLDIPTIGIGAGAGCNGQVLVLHDLLGLFDRFTPRFARQYTNLSTHIVQAVQSYCADVRDKTFPGSEHSAQMADQEWEQFLREVE